MKHLLQLALCLLLFSCNQAKEHQEHLILNINTDKISEGSPGDPFKIKEIIVLDTVKAALLKSGKAGGVMFIKDKILVSDFSPVVKIFDRKSGKLYKAIDKSGRGPQEYAFRQRFLLQEGELFIARGNDKSLMYYDIEGNFIKKDTVSDKTSSVAEILNIPSGGLLVYSGLMSWLRQRDKDKPCYGMTLLSAGGDTVKQMLEIPVTFPKVPVISSVPAFRMNKDEILFMPLTDHVIYKYHPQEHTFTPLYTLNYDGIDFRQVMESSGSASGNDQLNFINKLFMGFMYYCSDRYILLGASCESKERSIYVMIDRKTAEYRTYDTEKDEVLPGQLIPNSEGLLVQYLSYSSLMDKEGNPKETPLVKEIGKHMAIDENTNGVLVIYE